MHIRQCIYTNLSGNLSRTVRLSDPAGSRTSADQPRANHCTNKVVPAHKPKTIESMDPILLYVQQHALWVRLDMRTDKRIRCPNYLIRCKHF
jgi:hypothetical protein